MNSALRLIIFDVDGTLVDSQRDIIAAMTRAFDGVGLPHPPHSDILSIVGLSLDEAMAQLVPDAPQDQRAHMVKGYKDAYIALRAQTGAALSSPLYAGAADTLAMLNAVPDNILGVATGKSRRGLDKLLAAHGLERMFLTQQVADFHPSKPHPSMIHAAMRDIGVGPAQTVMIGDTSYDMDMAKAAGVGAIGVSWGYHDVSRLHAADRIVDSFTALGTVLQDILEARV